MVAHCTSHIGHGTHTARVPEVGRDRPSSRQLFHEWDLDASGLIDAEEFRHAMTMLQINDVEQQDIDALFAKWDEDGSGEIDFEELHEGITAAIKAEKEARRTALAASLSAAEKVVPTRKASLAEGLWSKIASRTDELFEVAVKMHPLYARSLSELLAGEGLPAEILQAVNLMTPVEVYAQASSRPDSFPRTEGLAEAYVRDVISARMVCTTGAQMVQVAERLMKRYTSEATGVSFELVCLKNSFADLMPTHFRMLTFSLRLAHAGVKCYSELQIHYADSRKYNEEQDAHTHYDFFRLRMSTGTGESDDAAARVDETLEKVLSFLIEAAAVPVLLSLLVLVFSTSSGAGEEDLEMLPQSAYELYSMATQSAVVQRLLAMGKPPSTADSGEGGGAASGEGESKEPSRRERRQQRKSLQGGGADWRKGAALPKSESAVDMGLSDQDIYLVYKTVAKVLTLFAQGRQGMSELKQAHVTKDKQLRPLIFKMLDVATKQTSPTMEAAGLNMLRLVAVDNQKQGRREFTSVHVANSLVKGGRDFELPLWLRLDVEEAGVTLIKTLESLTESAPALYQFKHLSFQEGLFARDLLGLVDKKQWKGWVSDAAAAEFLNNAYMNNVCRIAAGELGKRLAKARPMWTFTGDASLTWVGKAALWSLVKSNDFITALDVSSNAIGPGSAGTEADLDANGLASLFTTCPNLKTVLLGSNSLGAFSTKQLSRLVKGLSGNHSLTELDLQSNHLGADGVKMVANALRLCAALRTLDLSRNQPGGRPEALVQLVKEHAHLETLRLVEDDDKALPSKAKSMLGEAMRHNPAHRLHFVSCDAFALTPAMTTLKWTSSLAADVTLLAGALRSNTTLTALQLEGASIAEAERTHLGKALLENTAGAVGYCDTFELTPSTTELRWDMKDSSNVRKGLTLLMALLRANRTLLKVSFAGLGTDMVPMLAQSMKTNTTLTELVLEHQLQKLKGQSTVTIALPVQELTGSTGVASIDLSTAGELSKNSCLAMTALIAHSKVVTSLRLSGTKLGDEAGSLLPMLEEQCKSGQLATLDLSSIGLSDRGARKLFDAVMSGEYPALHSLLLSGNTLKDLKANGLVDMLRAEDCPLTALDVSSNPLSGAMVLRSLKFNSSLTYLNVCGTELDDAGVHDFGQMLLQSDCSCPIRALSCDHFEVRAETTAISFAGKGDVSSSILTLLCGILRLNQAVTTLDLSGVKMDNEAAVALETALKDNRALTSIDLRDNKRLWELSASDGGGSAEGGDGKEGSAVGLEALARGLLANTTVVRLRVDALDLQVKTLKGVGDEPPTEISYAANASVSDVSAAFMCALLERNLVAKALDLSGIKGVGRLGHSAGRCLGGNTALQSMLLRDSQLGDAGASALADGLRRNGASRVKLLDLASNGIGAAGAEALSSLLTSSTSLVKLDLASNALGSSGATALVPGLKTNTSLTSLSLRENEIEAAGARALAEALRSNGALSTLWLGKNKLLDDGVVAVAEALMAARHKSKMSVLDLHKTGITKVGISSLTQLVGDSPTLTALGLAGIKMQFTETEVLQSAGKEKPELGRAKAVRLWMGTDMTKWPEF